MGEPRGPRRFFFVHIQKTAGTTLYERLRRHFGAAGVYPDASDGDPVAVAPQLSVDVLLDRWAARRDEIEVVAGHFPLCTTELLHESFTTFTVLRDPVERTLSYLRHHRALTPGDQDVPLEAVYGDEFRFRSMVHNQMVKMFSLTVDEMTGGMLTTVDFTPQHLERAKQRLGDVDVVGLQERFEPFCDELERRYGWDLGPPLVANRTAPTDVTSSFRARIAADNALDVELYEHARELVADRRREGSAPLAGG
jgi:hypothetical protein